MIKSIPVFIEKIEPHKYVYARCRCPVPITHAIKIPIEPNKYVYQFHCLECGLYGEVIIGGGGFGNVTIRPTHTEL